jgi:hypothetical protein
MWQKESTYMSITLNLSPDVEKDLMAQARERGMPLSDYLQEVVTRQARESLPLFLTRP